MYDELEEVKDLDIRSVRRMTGDIHPTDPAPVIGPEHGGSVLKLSDMHWGFPSYKKGSLLINARAESVLDKPSFRYFMEENRCAVPVSSFYEWDRAKEKVTFSWEKHPIMYLAGCYQKAEDGEHFVIITTMANDSMLPVHDRMPLIFGPDLLESWIFDRGKTDEYLRMVPPQLHTYRQYEQLSFF